jgi:hypothetical protein
MIIEAEKTFVKPKLHLVGQDGNIYNLIGAVSKALKRNGYYEKAKEMSHRAMSSDSYTGALAVLLEYYDEDNEDDFEE